MGRLAALFQFVPGEHPDATPTDLEAIGALMAKVHACDTSVALGAYNPGPRELLRRVLKAPYRDVATRDFFADAARECQGLPWQELPRGVVHCDVFLDNLILDRDGVLHLIDWEEVARDAFLLDIARAIIGCCRVEQRMDLTLAGALVRGYQRGRVLSGVEREVLHRVSVHAGLLSTFWRYEQLTLSRPEQGRVEMYRELMGPTMGLMALGQPGFDRAVFPECVG